MWDRRILKSNAKTALRGRYWLAFAVALVACILAGHLFTGGMNPWSLGQVEDAASRVEQQIDGYDDSYYYDYYGDYMDPWEDPYYSYPYGHNFGPGYHEPYEYYDDHVWDDFGPYGGAIVSVLLLIGVLAFGFGTAFRVFVSNPVDMGKCRYFVHNRFGDSRFEHLFSAFRAGYLTATGAMFTTDLLIDLWLYILFVIVIVSLIAILNGVYMMVLLMMLSLLLLIPYVIKSYQYGFVKYLLADNPQLKGTRARQLSTMLTNGEKGSIFVLDLSFIGWYLLGALCLGLGHLFVNPYYEATRAELYIFLRERAIQNGLIDPRELNLYTNPPIPPYGMPPQQKDTTYVMYQKTSQAGPNSPYGTVPPVYPGSSVPTQGPVQGYTPNGVFQGASQNPFDRPQAPYGRNASPYPGNLVPPPPPYGVPSSESQAAQPPVPGSRESFGNMGAPVPPMTHTDVPDIAQNPVSPPSPYGVPSPESQAAQPPVPGSRESFGNMGAPVPPMTHTDVPDIAQNPVSPPSPYGVPSPESQAAQPPVPGSGESFGNTGAPVNPAEHVNTQMDTQNVVDVSEGAKGTSSDTSAPESPLPSGTSVPESVQEGKSRSGEPYSHGEPPTPTAL